LKTATELLLDHAARIREGIEDLLARSSMTQMDRDWGSGVWLGPTDKWGKLDVECHRIQSRILEEYGRFFDTVRIVLRGLPSDALRKLEESHEAIRKVIKQNEVTWLGSVDGARTSALSARETQCKLLDRLHDAGGGTAIYLPNTNALLHNIDLERWDFADCDRVELVLGPSILVELDELKINHRNPDVRTKAEGLISRIKGYRARGRLTQGVPLRKPASTIMAIATEPRLDESLPWLDPETATIASSLRRSR